MPAATVSDMASVARSMFRDFPTLFQERYTAPGGAHSYSLGVPAVRSSDFSVTVDNVAVNADDYTLDSRSGVLVLDPPADEGADVVVSGYHHEWFSDEDLELYVELALDNYNQSEGSAISRYLEMPAYANLIGIAGLVEGLWALVSETARDIDVLSPETNIPASQRYRNLYQLLQWWLSELRRREQALNVGMYKLEVFNLRRISYTTGRLVPVYTAQEFDDLSYAVRQYPPIDPGTQRTAEPEPSVFSQRKRGDAWEVVLNFFTPDEPPVAIDMSGHTYLSQLRRKAGSPVIDTWEIDTTDAADGIIRLSLDADATAKIQPGPMVWDLEQDGDHTVISGTMEITADVTRA